MINQSVGGGEQQSYYKAHTLSEQSPPIKVQAVKDKPVHSSIQIVLILVLLIVSVSSVSENTHSLNQHLRYLRTYFNFHLLQKQDLGLYEEGENIDENDREFVLLHKIRAHLSKLLNSTNTLQLQGIAAFQKSDSQYVSLEAQFRDNNRQIISFADLEQAIQYFHHFDNQFIRSFLLRTARFRISLPFGNNRILSNFTMIAQYTSHSYSMVEVQINYSHLPQGEIQAPINALRIIQQILASLLFMIYTFRLLSSQKDASQIKARGWLAFLALTSLITLVSGQYTCMATCLQLLPVFQLQSTTKTGSMLQVISFNNHLMFSVKLIGPILLSGWVLLNGFIFYSMLMYPGSYFDSYSLSFFSYVYQMFQCGIYENFTELKDHGYFALILYFLLFFYLFVVGNSLAPALFCILIQMKITEHNVQKYTHELVNHSHCPKCNYTHGRQLAIEIVINSSKLLPLIPKNNKLQRSINNQQQMVLMIEQDANQTQLRYRYNVQQRLAGYSRRIQSLVRGLSLKVERKSPTEWLAECLAKIQDFSQRQLYV